MEYASKLLREDCCSPACRSAPLMRLQAGAKGKSDMANIMEESMDSTVREQGIGSKLLIAAVIVIAAGGGIASFLYWVYSLR